VALRPVPAAPGEHDRSDMARITIADVQRMKAERRMIVMLTAYYY
jgi:hypothetical protein